MFRLGARRFADGEYAVMAIINRTPDSFFDRGATFAEDAALRAVEIAVGDGADIIDIGGGEAGPGDNGAGSEGRRRTIFAGTAGREKMPQSVLAPVSARGVVAG